MRNPEELRHIVRLLDDDSPVVRAGLASALASYGPGLGRALVQGGITLSGAERDAVRELLGEARAARLRRAWKEWIRIEDDLARLEGALSALAEFQDGWVEADTLPQLLDALADEFRVSGAAAGARTLASFLFSKRLGGDSEDYYRPDNSNLAAVLRTGRGLPISLCVIYALVGRRVGVPVALCNFPRHFLARVAEGDRDYLVDCFGGGRFHDVTRVLSDAAGETPAAARAILNPPETRSVVARVLNNLIHAYARADRGKDAVLVQDLLKDMYRADEQPEGVPSPEFRPGQLVRHRHHGYRGVIVDFDLVCRAGMNWYLANPTRPDRNQPWYSVLVDGGDQVTYAAQTSLAADDSADSVANPLVPHFFSGFAQGAYVRNARPWPRI